MKLQDVLASCGQDGEIVFSSGTYPHDDGRFESITHQTSVLHAKRKALLKARKKVESVLDSREEDSSRSVAVFGMRLPNPYEVADLEDEVHNIEQKLDELVEPACELLREWGVMPLDKWFSWPGAAMEVLECLDTKIDAFEGRDSLATRSHQLDEGTAKNGQSNETEDQRWILPMRPKDYSRGQDLCDWMFPHLSTARSKGQKSLQERFEDEATLKKVVSKAVKIGSLSPHRIRAMLKVGAPYPTNFPPMVAQAVFERFTPYGGTIWDPCGGWGGRMLGALTSQQSYTYIATDVDSDTVDCLRRLGTLIEAVTGRVKSFRVIQCGSEEYCELDGDVDCVFTSPPYFDAEDYGADRDGAQAQSHVQYNAVESWVEGYVVPTVDNIARALKPGCRAVINIADRTRNTVDIVDAWVEASLDAGLVLEDAPVISLTKRRGKGKSASGTRARANVRDLVGYRHEATHEPLLVFRRP